MLALSSLALAAMLLPCPAARAGHWEFTCTGSGSAHLTSNDGDIGDQTWTPSATPSTGVYFGIPKIGFGPTSQSGASVIIKATADITAHITFTWKHDAGQTDATDPAPTKLRLSESGSAQWTAQSHAAGGGNTTGTGSANDGIGDLEKPDPATGTATGGLSSSANAPTQPPPGMHLKTQTVSGGTFTLDRTFHAEAKATLGPPVNGGPGACTIAAFIGDYRVAIHAQPYNWHQTLGQDNGDGTISFKYAWLSTSGNILDLTSCYSHERVAYPGGDPYLPPLPFLLPPPGLHNPTVLPGTLKNGIPMTSTTTNGDTHYVWATSSKYSDFTTLTVSATQRYEFDDTGTGETNILVPGPDSNPSITRVIYPVGTLPLVGLADWWYSVTKNSVSSTKKVMSHP